MPFPTFAGDSRPSATDLDSALRYNRGAAGSQTRTAWDKHAEMPSVLDFSGADPSGATSSHIAFRNAFEWAIANDCEIAIPPADALKYYKLTDEIGINLPDTLQWGRGLTIRGRGAGARILVSHTGHGIRLYTSASANDSRVDVEISNLTFRGGAGDFSSIVPSTFIYNEFGINTRFRRLRFMSSGVSDACIKTKRSYGATYDTIIMRGIVGNGIRMIQDHPDSTGYSHVQNLNNCDFAWITGKCIHHDAGNCLNIVGGNMAESGYGVYVDPTAASGLVGVNINLTGVWFEANTNEDIYFNSNANSWVEGSVNRCQFSGNGAVHGKIYLGTKSRLFATGWPAGNNVQVTGSGSAGFIGIGTNASKWINNGLTYWSEIDPIGQSRLTRVASHVGATSIPSGSATALHTFPEATAGTWFVSTAMAGGSPANWGVMAVVTVSNGVYGINTIKAAAVVSLSVVGNVLMATQSTGTAYTLDWSVLRTL